MAAPLIVRTPIHDDDLSGTTGTILDNAWKQELYNQIDADVAAVVAGQTPAAWKDIAAGTTTVLNDTGVGLAATFTLNRYRQLGGNTVVWECGINPIAITGSTSLLYITGFPFTILGPTAFYPVAFAHAPAYLQMASGATFNLRKQDQTNWVANNFGFCYLSIIVEASGG